MKLLSSLKKLETQDYIVLAALGGLAYLWYKKETVPALVTSSPRTALPSSGGGGGGGAVTTIPETVITGDPNQGGIGDTIMQNSDPFGNIFGDNS